MTPAEERMVATLWRRMGEMEDKVGEAIQRQYSGAAAAGAIGGRSGRGRIARATTAIGASDETTPGGGTVQPMKLDGGDYADVGDPIAVKNLGDAISSGKRCSYWIDVDGVAWIEPGECEEA